LIGAQYEKELVVCSSLTENIHKLLAEFYKPIGKRFKILVPKLEFPSDIYAITSWLKLRGYQREDALIEIDVDLSDA
jgi:kynureninase